MARSPLFGTTSQHLIAHAPTTVVVRRHLTVNPGSDGTPRTANRRLLAPTSRPRRLARVD
jgi:hypothetical protein